MDGVIISDENIINYPHTKPCIGIYYIKNTGAETTLTLNYKDLVWDPSFEEEVTPTRGLMKGVLVSPKQTEIDATLEGSGLFDNPEPSFPIYFDER